MWTRIFQKLLYSFVCSCALLYDLSMHFNVQQQQQQMLISKNIYRHMLILIVVIIVVRGFGNSRLPRTIEIVL